MEEKTIKEIIINTINKNLPGIKALENDYGNITVLSQMTDFMIAFSLRFLKVSPDYFWEVSAIMTPEEEDTEIVTKIFKSISTGLYEKGYYSTSFSLLDGLYLRQIEELKVISKFSDILETLKMSYRDTTVRISEKKGNRIIISGAEGSVVLRRLDGSDKMVVESGLPLALRLYEYIHVNTSRLYFSGVFELYDYDNN